MQDKHFEYTYSPREQAEIKKIREKYLPRQENTQDKLAQLKKLDESVEQKANMIALIFGIGGALILGLGMSLILSELGASLGLSVLANWLIGVVLGLIGMAMACLAYPVYLRITRRERERLAPRILQLTEELLK